MNSHTSNPAQETNGSLNYAGDGCVDEGLDLMTPDPVKWHEEQNAAYDDLMRQCDASIAGVQHPPEQHLHNGNTTVETEQPDQLITSVSCSDSGGNRKERPVGRMVDCADGDSKSVVSKSDGREVCSDSNSSSVAEEPVTYLSNEVIPNTSFRPPSRPRSRIFDSFTRSPAPTQVTSQKCPTCFQHKKIKPLVVNGESSSLDDEDSTDQDDGHESGDHCHSNKKKDSVDKAARTKLVLASVLCMIFMIGEMVGGLLAGSLAIISDAAHLLTDFASFMISLVALYLASKPATKNLSFGWYRAEILGALTSILMLWVLTGILVYSAVNRVISDDYEINATIMLITAGSGVAFNILLGTTLHQHSHSHGGGHGHSHGGHGHSHGGKGHTHGGQGHTHGGGHGHSHKGHDEVTKPLSTSRVSTYGSVGDVEYGGGHNSDNSDLSTPLLKADSSSDSASETQQRQDNINVKAAFIHVIGDLLQSIGVLVAAFIIYFKPEWKIADPICTFLFSVFVLVTTMSIMKDILVVLMEGTPRGINFQEVRESLLSVDGVRDIHNLRVWSLTMDKMALSVHLAIAKDWDPHRVLKLASREIQLKFGISETTMQIEEYVMEMSACDDCKGPS